MWTALLTLVPVGLALGLVAFGQYGERTVVPTRRNVAATAAAAVLLGPVAVAALGFLLWMAAVAVVVGLVTMLALLRVPQEPAH